MFTQLKGREQKKKKMDMQYEILRQKRVLKMQEN